jgi:hypothetical protein
MERRDRDRTVLSKLVAWCITLMLPPLKINSLSKPLYFAQLLQLAGSANFRHVPLLQNFRLPEPPPGCPEIHLRLSR